MLEQETAFMFTAQRDVLVCVCGGWMGGSRKLEKLKLGLCYNIAVVKVKLIRVYPTIFTRKVDSTEERATVEQKLLVDSFWPIKPPGCFVVLKTKRHKI